MTYRIIKAQFVLSAPTVSLLGCRSLPELAVCGRSNVGKSTFINTLCGQNKLARVSKTPGRTRALNRFDAQLVYDVDGARQVVPMSLIDLPGYGYAQLSLKERAELSNLITDYFESKPSPRCVLHLLDIRREPDETDTMILEGLQALQIPFAVVLTKTDKLPKMKQKPEKKRISERLQIPPNRVVLSSALMGMGLLEVMEFVGAELS